MMKGLQTEQQLVDNVYKLIELHNMPGNIKFYKVLSEGAKSFAESIGITQFKRFHCPDSKLVYIYFIHNDDEYDILTFDDGDKFYLVRNCTEVFYGNHLEIRAKIELDDDISEKFCEEAQKNIDSKVVKTLVEILKENIKGEIV